MGTRLARIPLMLVRTSRFPVGLMLSRVTDVVAYDRLGDPVLLGKVDQLFVCNVGESRYHHRE